MTVPVDGLRLSEMVDGELTADQAAEVLLSALEDESARHELRELLSLRQATSAWRAQISTAAPPESSDLRPANSNSLDSMWMPTVRLRLGRLGVAAAGVVLGGLLVLGGVLAGRSGTPEPTSQVATSDGAPSEALIDPPSMNRALPGADVEQLRQIASVFAFHESVAGPLQWYAADDREIELAAASGGGPLGRPIAVLLRIGDEMEGSSDNEYVIVCREGLPATIDLPRTGGVPPLRLFLAPTARNGTVAIRYSLATILEADGGDQSAVVGRRDVGLMETSLGQLALGDRFLNVRASASPLESKGI
ncbi:MAG: hypothetical protein WD069_22925 [Planctomycetales bacterium]